MRIIFDNGPLGEQSGFSSPIHEIIAHEPADILDCFRDIKRAQASGYWLAGFMSYELGFALEERLIQHLPPSRKLPLLAFGVYEMPRKLSLHVKGEAGLRATELSWNSDEYRSRFLQVHDAIGRGDIYQANLTFSAQYEAFGSAASLYALLGKQQGAPHGVFLDGGALGAFSILSRSPELFFATDREGKIITRPMKGTAPRHRDPVKDQMLAAKLANDEKNQAENLMIVDLLRNDLSRITVPGSVQTSALFEIETYETVHQMTSTIEGQLKKNISFSDIIQALFPCGSITGAPKIRAMEILSELEAGPREIYCGSIGWAAPDGSSCLNVAIRTLLVEGKNARLDAGGGIVWDSRAESEYEEALWKLRYASLKNRNFA